MYVVYKNKSACLFCSFSSEFYFIGDKSSADHFKYKITPSLKENDRLKLAQDVALKRVREKGKPQCKLSYKILKEEYWYAPMLDISTNPTLIQLKGFICGIQNYVTVVGQWILQ